MGLRDLFALVLAAMSPSAESTSRPKESTIKISNVCINIVNGYEYNITSRADYFLINVNNNGAVAFVYVGHNPQILDKNRKWQSRSVRSKMKSSQIVFLEDNQAGQILGVPLNETDQYFHIWFKGNDIKLNKQFKNVAEFCR